MNRMIYWKEYWMVYGEVDVILDSELDEVEGILNIILCQILLNDKVFSVLAITLHIRRIETVKQIENQKIDRMAH